MSPGALLRRWDTLQLYQGRLQLIPFCSIPCLSPPLSTCTPNPLVVLRTQDPELLTGPSPTARRCKVVKLPAHAKDVAVSFLNPLHPQYAHASINSWRLSIARTYLNMMVGSLNCNMACPRYFSGSRNEITMSNKQKVALVTGCTTGGIGYHM